MRNSFESASQSEAESGQELLEQKIQESPYFTSQEYRIPTDLWTKNELGEISPSEYKQAIEKITESSVDNEEDVIEKELSFFKVVPAEFFSHGGDRSKQDPQLSPDFVARAEQLSGDQQEAFLRGYADFAKTRGERLIPGLKDSERLLKAIGKGEIPPEKRPAWLPQLAEGMIMRSLEDTQITGVGLKKDLKLIQQLEEKTGATVLESVRPTIKKYLERQEPEKVFDLLFPSDKENVVALRHWFDEREKGK